MFIYAFLGLGGVIGVLGLVSGSLILFAPSRWQRINDKFDAVLFPKNGETSGPRVYYGMILISLCVCILWFVYVFFKQTL